MNIYTYIIIYTVYTYIYIYIYIYIFWIIYIYYTLIMSYIYMYIYIYIYTYTRIIVPPKTGNTHQQKTLIETKVHLFFHKNGVWKIKLKGENTFWCCGCIYVIYTYTLSISMRFNVTICIYEHIKTICLHSPNNIEQYRLSVFILLYYYMHIYICIYIYMNR